MEAAARWTSFVRSLAVGLALGGPLLVGTATPADACMWTPPPPFCAKTLVLSHAVPQVILLPGGGAFDVETLIYFGLWDFPPGSGICPGGPYTVDIDYTLTCTGGGGGVGSAVGLPVTAGFTEFTIPITIPAGPPRLCSLAGIATMTLADGMVITASPRAMPVCVGEPAAANPAEPRIDMLLLGGDVLAAVQPGDQAGHTYRIINNDLVETFAGELLIEMVSTSKMPGASGPMPPGTGVFSVSDPGPGDNFPIALDHGLFDGCVPMPDDPASFLPPVLSEPILLPPGGFVDIDVFSRPWGMCKNGSCGQASLVLDGAFSDLSAGLACAGFVTAADIAAPPQFLWPDAGAVALFPPPLDPAAGVLPLLAPPVPGPPLGLELHTQGIGLEVGGNPLPVQVDFFSQPFVDQDHGRTQVQLHNGGAPVFLPPDPFMVTAQVQMLPEPGAPFTTEIRQLDLIGAPTGFEQTAPGLHAQLGILPIGPPAVDSHFDITGQISAVGIDENGERRDVQFSTVNLAPNGPTGFNVELQGLVGPGSGTQILALELALDFHGFAFEAPSPLQFIDGFESGNTSRWSLTVPPPPTASP